MDALRVEIDQAAGRICVYNNRDGILVEVHREEGVYVPELIFGHLLTSSNYDDAVKKTTGGRNGYGTKLTNIFSTDFVVESADGRRLKKYKQVFTNNMGIKGKPVISKCKEGENWTKITFKPNLAKFNMIELEDDVVTLMKKRVVDLAGTLGKTVKVELNGQWLPVKTFQQYVDLYLKSADKGRLDSLPRMYEANDRWEVCVSLSEGQFQQVSQFSGYVSEHSAYHHGEASLAATILGMANDFLGSNNINLLEKTASKEAGVTYTISGIIEEVDNTTLRITKLPVRRWTQDYKEFLESMMTGNDKIKEPFIKDYRQYNDDRTVNFEIILSKENMNIDGSYTEMKRSIVNKNLGLLMKTVMTRCIQRTR